VYHEAGAGAERLGRELGEIGYFRKADGVDVALARRGDTWPIYLLVREGAVVERKNEGFLRSVFGPLVAADVFPGLPVELRLCVAPWTPSAAAPVPASDRIPVGAGAWVYHPVADRVVAERIAEFVSDASAKPNNRYTVRTEGGVVAVVPLHFGGSTALAASPAVWDSAQVMARTFSDILGGPSGSRSWTPP
jgi:hypothetical protein